MKLRRIGAVVVVVGLAAVACGKAAEVVAPRVAVREAAQSTFDGSQGRFSLSLVGDQADMAALLEASAEDRELLDALRESRISVSIDGGDEADRNDDRFALEVDLGPVDQALELRMVDKTLYVRGDVAGLVRLFEAEAGTLSEVVNGAQQAGLGFVADAVAGKWLALDLAPLEEMAGGAGQPGGELPKLGGPQFQKLLDAVSATFGEDVDVKRLGQEDPGQHYRLTVPLRRVYERLLPSFGELFAMPPGIAPPPANEVPDRSVSLDVWTDDGRIRRAEVVLNQLIPGAPEGPVALRVDFESLGGGITAPGGAVAVNVTEIFNQLMAGLGAQFGGVGS